MTQTQTQTQTQFIKVNYLAQLTPTGALKKHDDVEGPLYDQEGFIKIKTRPLHFIRTT